MSRFAHVLMQAKQYGKALSNYEDIPNILIIQTKIFTMFLTCETKKSG